MCGIVGIISKDVFDNRNLLNLALDSMAHRGPDGSGVWWSEDGCVGLGHRRLAIIDLSSLAQQPMQDITGSLTIVFNGEIYNYHDLRRELIEKGYIFRSHSDTEVILAAYRQWGIDCVSRLNGMFAFAIYDSKQRNIFLARDRAGEKPLFYSLNNGTLRFASELKGLLVDPSFSHRINHDALDTYLTIGYVPGDLCIVQGANKLPAAHAMLFDLKSRSFKIWKYWELPPSPTLYEASHIDETALLSEFEDLLQDAVQKQLTADVPVGVLLSGGVDSSLITAMAARTSNTIKTFTVGFSGFDKYDESSHARLIADYFGTEHIELNAGKASPDLLPLLARQYDEPMADSSMIPTYLVSRLVRQHCKVALGGDGGDELFGGYAHYDRLLWKQQNVAWIPAMLKMLVASGASTMLPVGFKGRNWLLSLACDLNHELPTIATFFDGPVRQRLLGDHGSPLVGEYIWQSRVPSEHELLQRVTRMDFKNYLAEDILVKVDRASMMNSLELRAPLLDHRVVEFAFGRVPSFIKTSSTERKIFLKKLGAKLLPSEFDLQRKQGFSVPLTSWLRKGPWRDSFHDILLDTNAFFNKKTILELLRGQDKGFNNNERLFNLVLFELWRREYSMSM